MRSPHPPAKTHPADRTARAAIRDEALRLFATHGPDAVTIRAIASAAGTSPALVMRHHGSKDGLRAAVDAHALATLEAMFEELTAQPESSPYDPAGQASIVAAMVEHLPADSPLPRYLARSLLDGSGAGRELFARVFALGQRTLDELVAAGLAEPGATPHVRAAILTVTDLAMFLLRDHITHAIGTDPLTPAGMHLWGSELMTIYAGGLVGAPASTPTP